MTDKFHPPAINDRGISNRALEHRITHPKPTEHKRGSYFHKARESRPYFLHLIYGDRTPINRDVRRVLEDRVRLELNLISPDGEHAGAFFIIEHDGNMKSEWINAMRPRDIPVYLLRPEAARLAGDVARRHAQIGGFTIGQGYLEELREAIAGGTVDDEPGRNINSDVDRVRRGVSFVRVWEVTRSVDPIIQGTFFGEGVLHEFGHHFLDDPGMSAHRFGSIMEPVSMKFGSGIHHFTKSAVLELRRRLARLP